MHICGAKFQEHCFDISRDKNYCLFSILPFLVANNDAITDTIRIIEKRQYLYMYNEKRYLKRKNTILLYFEVIFQKRVRMFHRGFKHEKTDESTRPQASCFYCFRVFETPMKHEARVFEITSPTKGN